MRILHISNDEKFIDSAIDLFEEVAPGDCGYLVNGVSQDQLKFVKRRPENLFVHPYMSKGYMDSIGDFNPGLLFIHSLSINHKQILDAIGPKYPVFWSSWGRDIYSSARLSHLMYKRDTYNLVNRNPWDLVFFKKKIGQLLNNFRNSYKAKPSESYLKYCTHLSTVVEEDFDVFTKAYPLESSHLKYVPFNYGGFYLENSGTNRDNATGDNLIIGNSANPESNHLESLRLIKDIDLANRKVYMPLSYGGNKRYVDEVVKAARYYLGKNFHPLVDFIPLAEYEKILNSVGYAIMNHSHQHAMGNIISLIYKGAKIFMDPDNTACQSLRRMGFHVASIDSVNTEDFFTRLSDVEIDENKGLIGKHYSRQALVERTRNLLQSVRG